MVDMVMANDFFWSKFRIINDKETSAAVVLEEDPEYLNGACMQFG